MKVLFDEDVPQKLARLLPRHEIHTVVSMQWGGIKNGELLTLIECELGRSVRDLIAMLDDPRARGVKFGRKRKLTGTRSTTPGN